MANNAPAPWTGVRLLSHLTARLDPAVQHLPLNLHTLHAFGESRPALLTGCPDDATELAAFGYELGILKRIRGSGWWHVDARDPELVATHSMRAALLGAFNNWLTSPNKSRSWNN